MKVQLNAQWQPGDGEVDLFKKMSYILSSTYSVTFIEEVHKKSINFLSPTIKSNAKREIADLWIIAYSLLHGKAKMTFLQAKYHKAQLAKPGLFSADFYQYELLSTRPSLTTGGSYNFPLDILKVSCCDSVGSYGVFYLDANNHIDLAYCSANQLVNTSVVPTTYGQHQVELMFPATVPAFQNCSCNVCQELNYTYDINIFTDSILRLEIGADIQHFPHILKFINSVVAKLDPTTATRDLRTFIANATNLSSRRGDGGDGGVNEIGTTNDGLPSHLLIINVDRNEAKR